MSSSSIEDGRRASTGASSSATWSCRAGRSCRPASLLLPRSRTLAKLNLQRGATEARDRHARRRRCASIPSISTTSSATSASRQLRYLNDAAQRAIRSKAGRVTGAGEFGLAEPPLPEDYVVMGDFNMVPEIAGILRAWPANATAYYGRPLRARHIRSTCSPALDGYDARKL